MNVENNFMKGFMSKPIPTLTGEEAKRFVEMAESNERKYKYKCVKNCDDTIKKVMEKQERYLRSQC